MGLGQYTRRLSARDIPPTSPLDVLTKALANVPLSLSLLFLARVTLYEDSFRIVRPQVQGTRVTDPGTGLWDMEGCVRI
jgi:hypothetical protein